MREVIKNRVSKFSEDMLLHYATPNRNLVVEILMLDAATIGQLHRKQLSQYVLVLGQHLVTLQYNENLKNVEHLLLSKTFEYKIDSAQFSYEGVQGTTAKAKRAWVLLNIPEVKELQEELIAAEAEKMIISKMVPAVEGLLNALKKELSSHYES
jgi:hypothetical protein